MKGAALPAYKCSVCNARFRHYDALEDHEAATSHRKPYGCDLCARSFNQDGRRNLHMAKAHKVDVSKSETSTVKRRCSTVLPTRQLVLKPEKE